MFKKSVINIEISNDIKQALEFSRLNNFDAIEIHSAWEKNIEILDKGELTQLNQLVKESGLQVSCISSTLFLRCYLEEQPDIAPVVKGFAAISGNYAYHLKALQNALDAAEILGAPLIRVFGFHKDSEPTDEIFIRAAERFQKPVEQAKRAGITLALETCPHTSFGWGENAAKLVKMVNSSSFRLLWDPAGSIRAGEKDCIRAMQSIMPLVAHVHAKDILLGPDGKHQYLTLGQGVVPWNTIFQELINKNFEGAVSIEPHFLGHNGTKAGAVVESLSAMQEIIDSLN